MWVGSRGLASTQKPLGRTCGRRSDSFPQAALNL